MSSACGFTLRHGLATIHWGFRVTEMSDIFLLKVARTQNGQFSVQLTQHAMLSITKCQVVTTTSK